MKFRNAGIVPAVERLKNNPDRLHYPEGVYRVSGGSGGEVVLIVGSKKTAIVDCGMPFDARRVIENIRGILGDRPLDYVFASHTHYDHIGGMGIIRQAYPGLVAYGSQYAKYVFTRPGAIETMKRMTLAAIDSYNEKIMEERQAGGFSPEIISYEDVVIDQEGIDVSLESGQAVDMGDFDIVAYSTPGHTNCSMSYFIPQRKILFSSESTGVPSLAGRMHTSILKSFDQSMDSLKLCRALGAETVIFPHYGVVKGDLVDIAWQAYETNAREERETLANWIKEGLTDQELLERVTEKFWTSDRAARQPKAAFQLNARYSIKMYRREVDEGLHS